jgi:hypothetical protein
MLCTESLVTGMIGFSDTTGSMVEHEIFLPQVVAHRSCQTDERTILVGSVLDGQSVPANRKSPSQLVLVAKRKGITTTWSVDQITRDFQPN